MNDMVLDTTTLATALPWTPLDFLRVLPEGVERDREAERLTRPLPARDDLRLSSHAADGSPLSVFAERLPWDSEFFGYDIARLNAVWPLETPFDPRADYRPAIAALIAAAKAAGIRYLFAPVDPRHLPLLRALGDAGFASIETRVLYGLALAEYTFTERFDVRLATPADVPILARTAREVVNPFDRFHADPALDAADVDRFMETWIDASINRGFVDETLVPNVDQPEAFCTVAYHEDLWPRWGVRVSRPVLSAVAPTFRGWYRKLISEVNYHARARGAEYTYVVTQATNIAAVHVCESLGFRFGRCEHIMRILL